MPLNFRTFSLGEKSERGDNFAFYVHSSEVQNTIDLRRQCRQLGRFALNYRRIIISLSATLSCSGVPRARVFLVAALSACRRRRACVTVFCARPALIASLFAAQPVSACERVSRARAALIRLSICGATMFSLCNGFLSSCCSHTLSICWHSDFQLLQQLPAFVVPVWPLDLTPGDFWLPQQFHEH